MAGPAKYNNVGPCMLFVNHSGSVMKSITPSAGGPDVQLFGWVLPSWSTINMHLVGSNNNCNSMCALYLGLAISTVLSNNI